MNVFLFGKNCSNSLEFICPDGYARVINSQIGFLWVKLCHCVSAIGVRGAKNKNSLSDVFLWLRPCCSCWWGLQLSRWEKILVSKCGSAKTETGVVGAGVRGPCVSVWRVVWEGLAGFPIRPMIWNLLWVEEIPCLICQYGCFFPALQKIREWRLCECTVNFNDALQCF